MTSTAGESFPSSTTAASAASNSAAAASTAAAIDTPRSSMSRSQSGRIRTFVDRVHNAARSGPQRFLTTLPSGGSSFDAADGSPPTAMIVPPPSSQPPLPSTATASDAQTPQVLVFALDENRIPLGLENRRAHSSLRTSERDAEQVAAVAAEVERAPPSTEREKENALQAGRKHRLRSHGNNRRAKRRRGRGAGGRLHRAPPSAPTHVQKSL